MEQQRWSTSAVFLLLAVLNGCTQVIDAEGIPSVMEGVPQAPTSTSTKAVSPLNAVTFQTMLFACEPTGGNSAWNTTSCGVPSDWVMVGGGASIIHPDPSHPIPGALLTGSFPVYLPSANFWVAKTKDHIWSYPHKLKAFAIGLQLNGLTAAQLRSQLRVVTAEGSTGATSQAIAQLPSGLLLVGGGATTSFTGAGHLLTASQPWGTNGWRAASKDHGTSDTSGKVFAYAIGIPQCPVGYSGCLVTQFPHNSIVESSGYGNNFVFPIADPNSFRITSVGAATTYDGPGRLLTDLFVIPGSTGIPPGGVNAWSKDHGWADSGTFTAYTVEIGNLLPPDFQ